MGRENHHGRGSSQTVVPREQSRHGLAVHPHLDRYDFAGRMDPPLGGRRLFFAQYGIAAVNLVKGEDGCLGKKTPEGVLTCLWSETRC